MLKKILKIIGIILFLGGAYFLGCCLGFFDSYETNSIPSWDKPVIYLYPEEKMDVEVKVENVDFTTTYPMYNNGWRVTAYPDGTLMDENGREYNYLYWEGQTENIVDISKGFVVSKNNYISFLEEKLADIGLSDREACDFITYWLPLMNEKEYCLVSFQMDDFGDLVINEKVDNELRVYVAFKGLDEYIEIDEQDLSYYDGFEREGFIVVEWGGTYLD